MGSGARIPLKFDPAVKVRGGLRGVGGVGMFPGAVVALRGKNGGGGWFLVEEILAVSLLYTGRTSLVGNYYPDAPHETLTCFFGYRDQTRAQ